MMILHFNYLAKTSNIRHVMSWFMTLCFNCYSKIEILCFYHFLMRWASLSTNNAPITFYFYLLFYQLCIKTCAVPNFHIFMGRREYIYFHNILFIYSSTAMPSAITLWQFFGQSRKDAIRHS